ncbi:MAG: sulfite exporter TauE/SafE family protein [Succinivibrionaceae bacterium]|nr:sulfite exporter TauE/SafE family protein [Succinivibrionaceae bacterium]
MQDAISQAVLFTVSFAANLLASVSGGGAGFIQFPLLIMLGLPFPLALGTHKVAVVFLGLGALARKGRGGSWGLDPVVSLIMLVVGVPAVALGSLIVISIPAAPAEVALGAITIACGAYSLLRRRFGERPLARRTVWRNLAGACLMALVGLFSGSLSSGAGLFATLVLVGVFRLDLKRAILHTMVFVASLWNLVGAFTVGAACGIHWRWIPVMVAATFLGSYLGTTLLQRLSVRLVRLAFSAVAILSGALLMAHAL